MHLFELVKRIRNASIWRTQVARWNNRKNVSITVPILSSCLLEKASSGLHITNRFALRMIAMIRLNPMILGESLKFVELKYADRYDKTKGFSAWGVYTPHWNCKFSKVQNFPLHEVFCSHWGVLILLTKPSGQLGHILLSLVVNSSVISCKRRRWRVFFFHLNSKS